MQYHNDPYGTRLPIKLDPTTNGEFTPVPLSPVHHHARRLALGAASKHARRLGLTRRTFLVSACGAASTLLAMNAAYAASGRRGGYYDLPAESALDMQLARSALDRQEFIFDVQGHFVNPTGAWTRVLPPGAQPLKSFTELKGCSAASAPGLGYLQCLGADAFIKDIFLDSDTDLVVLSFVPSTRKLGIRNIAIHKGLPFGSESYVHSTCVDVGRVAKRYPDVNFLIYHSGFVTGKTEGPYDPQRSDGVDALVTSLRENNIKPGSNVYAELGSTWRFLMRDPDAAAHALGKLFKHIGEDNVLWGTDSIWYGSPQDQIQAFRTFQISDALAAKHGYSKITPVLRAKVFGRNALAVYKIPADVLKKHLTADKVARERLAYRERADPAFVTYGPKTRREFLTLKARGG